MDIVPQFIANMIKIAGLVVLMLMVNPIISLSMFLAVFFVLLCEVLWLRGQRRHWRNRDIARRGVTSTLSDALNGHRVVKAFPVRNRKYPVLAGRMIIFIRLNTQGIREALISSPCSTEYMPFSAALYTVLALLLC